MYDYHDGNIEVIEGHSCNSGHSIISGQISFRFFPVFPGFPVLRNRSLGFFPPKFWKGFCGNHDRFLSFSVFAVLGGFSWEKTNKN